ncbi:MAG: hypothetical protein V4754_11985 [Pseudomonadota bacterium]
MEKLISELIRLYGVEGMLSRQLLAQRLLGESALPVQLTTQDGLTRAIVIAFPTPADGEPARHWGELCLVANALQTELGWSAPAVSIAGDGYGLWLSLEQATPAAQVQAMLALIHTAYMPDARPRFGSAGDPLALPPCPMQSGERWAAFIHPDLGASFSDEPWLDMAPPLAGQAALLEGLHSIGPAQFQRALALLEQSHGAASVADAPTITAPSLLLKDATLEDIVRFLHAKNIEPTFRHLIGT